MEYPLAIVGLRIASSSSRVRSIAASGQRNAMAASNIASSMCCPPAPRSRAKSAAVIAWAAVYAVTLSQTRLRSAVGLPVAGSVCTPAIPE